MQRILIGNIKGPQGAQGIQGPQGPVGATGPQGPMPDLVNNALATEAGVAALDAVMGKTLQDQITDLNSNITSIYLKKRIVCNYVAQANTTTQIDVPLDSIDGYTPVLHTLDYTSNDSVVCDAGYIVNKSLLLIYLTNKTNSNISNTAGLSILYMKDL